MTSKQEAIISGEQIKNMLLGAYKSFEKNYQYINDLNVFPVPDGDTGTNMMHTMAAVAREISQLQNATVSEVGTMAARSAIMGARGNSGVILSQLLRGLGKGLAGKKRATSNEVGKAFQFGMLTGRYQSLLKERSLLWRVLLLKVRIMLCVRVKILKMFYARRWRAGKKNWLVRRNCCRR